MLRAIYNFDHCAKSATLTAGSTVNPSVGFGYSNATLLAPASIGVGADGFMGGYIAGGTVNVAFDMTGIIPANPTKVTFGWRVRTLQVYSNTHAMISFSVPGTPNDTTAYMMTISPAAAPWVPAVGNDVYVELTYDFTTFTATAMVNGAPVAVTAGPVPSAAQKAAFVSGAWTINFVLANSLNARYAYRDIYVLDAVAGDGMVTPLGPQKMFPISLDAADGTGWVATGAGTTMDALNTALPANPYSTSPSDKTPLVTSLKTNAPAGSRVNAVSLSMSGTSIGDVASTSKVEISQGGANVAAKFVAVAKAITYGAPIGLFPKAPDGGSWDLSKIDLTTLKLTPDTIS